VKKLGYIVAVDGGGHSELALFAGTDTPGIVVISGTGSIVYGVNNDGKKVRIGGWDYDFNDLGS
jgi:N-acetylglucosamine kinase-like BadF-type ATPase